MDPLISQFLLTGGVLYGLIMLFVQIKKKENRSKNEMGLAIALIVGGGATLLSSII